MARISTVNKLPKDIKEQLNTKLLEFHFGDYDYLELWLNELGYSVSRSAIHRYATTYKADLITQNISKTLPTAKLRLKCLRIAFQLTNDLDEAKSLAEDFLKWSIKM